MITAATAQKGQPVLDSCGNRRLWKLGGAHRIQLVQSAALRQAWSPRDTGSLTGQCCFQGLYSQLLQIGPTRSSFLLGT